MARLSKKRRSQSSEVDLTSFLDIISTLFVVQLLMLCILSLSNGYSKINKSTKQQAEKETARPDFLITNSDNDSNVANATLLHCNGDNVNQYDGNKRKIVAKHIISDYSHFTPAGIAAYDYVYILVQSSCFGNFEKLLKDVKRWHFIKTGYEPLADDHNITWLK